MLEKLYQNNIYKKYREVLLCALDLCIVFVSFLLSYWINLEFAIPKLSAIYIKNALLVTIVVLLVYGVSFIGCKIHKSLWKYVGPIETIRICFAILIATTVLLALTVVLKLNREYLSIIVTAGLLTALLMFNVRVCYRLYRRRASKGDSKVEKAIIIGAGDAGYILLK